MEIRKLDHESVLSLLPDRDISAHKGNFGKILLLCGSVGYTGAAALAALGALRVGAGLVFLGVPASIYLIEAIKLTEAIVFPLPDIKGMFSEESIAPIGEKLKAVDAVLIGPGIGQSPACFSIVEYVLRAFHGPVVLDADGLNLIAAHKDILRDRTSPTLLTPHAGEFARLGGDVTGDRIHDAVAMAKDLNTAVVLKGHGTVITDGNQIFVNPTGNPGMAVGGCGDVLAGMITGLLGQGIEPLKAAACAAWLHGAAGDVCADELGQYGMLPTDMLKVLPRLMK